MYPDQRDEASWSKSMQFQKMLDIGVKLLSKMQLTYHTIYGKNINLSIKWSIHLSEAPQFINGLEIRINDIIIQSIVFDLCENCIGFHFCMQLRLI